MARVRPSVRSAPRVKNIWRRCWRAPATMFGLFWLGWILWTTLQQRHRRARPGPVHQDDAAAGRRRRPAQRVLRQRRDEPARRSLLGTPIGMLAGTYLAEYAQPHRALGETIRFVNDILLSAPSIVLGLFVYTLVVAPMGHFSALGRRDRARLHRAAGRRAHHRRNAPPGARADARSRAVAGRAAVEGDRAGALSRRRCRASSPASCSRWPASPAKPRRCCSPRSTTSTGPPI